MQFYILTAPPIDSREEKLFGTEAHVADGTTRGDAPRCKNCGHYIGMKRWLPPYRVELETWGKQFGDMVVMTYPDILVSQRFKELWEKTEMLGLSEFESVEVVKVKARQRIPNDPPKYFKTTVIRGGAAVDLIASDYQWAAEPDICPECQLDRKGVTFLRNTRTIIVPDSWTGEDLFLTRGGSDVVATDRFKRFCEDGQIKNAFLTPAEEFGHDFYPLKARLIGVHPVVASLPCHLIEIEIGAGKYIKPFDWGAITQEDPAQPRANWQAAYDETRLNDEGTRWAFFFHYLDLSKPLMTPAGPLAIPTPSSLPEHLRHLRYVEP